MNQRKFLFDRLARIIEHLHLRHIVHCDFQPLNICIFGLKWRLVDVSSCRYTHETAASDRIPLFVRFVAQ
jgi:RIO-like serine/threonine protein kinase